MPSRRLWSVHVDERSQEVGWIIGSKIHRTRRESGRLGSELQKDFAVPYNEGRPLPGWRVGLPQFFKGIPRDGKLLLLVAPDGNHLYLDMFYEHLGVPGSLLCELFANLEMIPAEEMYDAQVFQAHAAHVSPPADSVRRGRKAFRHLQQQENV